jgi:plastocyanin
MKLKSTVLLALAVLLAACGTQPVAGVADQPTSPVGSVPATVIPTLVPTLPPPAPSETVSSPTDGSLTATNPAVSTSTSGEAEVEIEDFAFHPAALTILAGTTVKFSNKDSVTHTVAADDGSWGSGNLAKGDDFFYTFIEPGTYTYHCGPHPAMQAVITVVKP